MISTFEFLDKISRCKMVIIGDTSHRRRNVNRKATRPPKQRKMQKQYDGGKQHAVLETFLYLYVFYITYFFKYIFLPDTILIGQ